MVSFSFQASVGSEKAALTLTQVAWARAIQLNGIKIIDEAPTGEFDATLASAIQAQFPFQNLQNFLDVLREYGYYNAPSVAQEVPFNEYSQYALLWKRKVSVNPMQLFHDAALYCANNWTPKEALQLCKAVNDNGADYNAQDVVAAMLFLIVSWDE